MKNRIVIIGAGSHCFGRGQIADLLQTAELRGRNLELVLVDTDQAALDRMHRLAQRIQEHVGSDFSLSSTTDRRAALCGAAFVVVAVARRRYPLWEQDFRVPLAHGVRHVLGENGGPGALFHALRSLHLLLPICRDMEELCPEALLLNFTNPEARVLHAILHLTRVRAAGICHGVFGAEQALCQYLDRPREALEITSAGMNHFYCILQAKELATGADLLPTALACAVADPEAPPLFRKLAEIFGVFSFPSDDHIGEYLAWGSEYHGVKWVYGQESRRVPFFDTPAEDALSACADDHRPLEAAMLAPSGEVTAPIIADILLDRKQRRSAVNVLNGAERFIDNLPPDAAVEVPAIVDAKGIHPLKVGPVPETMAAFMRTQFSIHTLVTEAYRTREKRLLLQALLLDPCMPSIAVAEHVLDDLLALQGDYLPEFR